MIPSIPSQGIIGAFKSTNLFPSCKDARCFFYSKSDSWYFGARTKSAVCTFQLQNNLQVDGIEGPYTFQTLFK
ncbi:peptidoglycan-binding protein [Bacillus sp. A301a_S52]|nr:peptidoglycan-binding protein [Bacillus sp. A301a_S52]